MGLDLSTQQLKAIVIQSDLKVVHEAKVDFDADLSQYGIKHGVLHPSETEVTAPVAMWIDALELVLTRLKSKGCEMERIAGISGAGQQHGSVYWSVDGEMALEKLDASKGDLNSQLRSAFTIQTSPNWQDSSTENECQDFDKVLGDHHKLAQVTGSKAHHRFTGPQIAKIARAQPDVYATTHRISLVSSFLASLFLGKIAPIDVSDACGMNLWDIQNNRWDPKLLTEAAGQRGADFLHQQLGDVRLDGGGSMGSISKYFVQKFGFSADCQIAPFTGDNPATILALPMRAGDAIVSLGTSTTFLMNTENYAPDPATHFFAHPTTAKHYMFMLCYKNGGLAREKIRDMLPKPPLESKNCWETFEKAVYHTPPLGQYDGGIPAKIGLYFPLPEIVPNVGAGTYRYVIEHNQVKKSEETWMIPFDDARAIVESQVMSLRLRSEKLVTPQAGGLPPQPRRIYLVGGGSSNPAISRLIGEVLGGAEGVYKLDVGGNACALGGAYKAVWAMERKEGESFEDLIGGRWKEEGSVKKVDEGYRMGMYDKYRYGTEWFKRVEEAVIEEQRKKSGRVGVE